MVADANARTTTLKPQDFLRQALELISEYPIKRVGELVPRDLSAVNTRATLVRLEAYQPARDEPRCG